MSPNGSTKHSALHKWFPTAKYRMTDFSDSLNKGQSVGVTVSATPEQFRVLLGPWGLRCTRHGRQDPACAFLVRQPECNKCSIMARNALRTSQVEIELHRLLGPTSHFRCFECDDAFLSERNLTCLASLVFSLMRD